MHTRYMRTSVESTERRRVDGSYGFVLQFNETHRSTKRRPHASMDSTRSLYVPFNEDSFNFTKLHEEEILVRLKGENLDLALSDGEHVIAINCNPLVCIIIVLEFGARFIQLW